MRRTELMRMMKRIPMRWMKKKVVMRRKKQMRMGRSRMATQRSDLQRRRRMKWIQRDRRQKMALKLESSPPISPVPSISPPPFQPVLALPVSLWLHTISDEERLETLSDGEDSSSLLTQRPGLSMTSFPS
uniref:Parathymosin n=1 Tax=Zonotrichia albicollis TaxID=44394 RepID=A0A8D2NJF8_ZONAL